MRALLFAVLLAAAAPVHAGNQASEGSGAGAFHGGPQITPQVPALPAGGLSLPVGQTGLGVTLPGTTLPSGVPASTIPGATLTTPDQAPDGSKGAPKISQTPGADASADHQPAAASGQEDASKKKASDPVIAGADKGHDGSQTAPSAKDARAPEISAETAKTQSDAEFDGSGAKQDSVPAAAAPKGFMGKLRAGLSRFTGAHEPKVKTAFDRDSYGGPQSVELTGKQKVLHGLRWGLTLTGISSLIQLTLGTIFSSYPWQLHVSKALLHGSGRVELLTGAGPHAIAQALASHPLAFMLFQMPLMTAKEELLYRGIQFGLYFLLLAAIRPAAAMAGEFIKKIPDLFGYGTLAQRALKTVAKVSGYAFPLAAAFSALHFTVAHFAAWGIDPATIAVHASLGFGLAYVAYKTRSLATAFTAHLTYNVLSVGAVLLALAVSTPAAMIYSLALSVVSLAGMYWHWRSYRKARGLAVAQAKLSLKNGVVGLLLAVMLGGSLVGMAPRSAMNQAALRQTAPQAWTVPVQQAAPQAKPDQKPGEEKIPEDVQKAIEQLKQMMGGVEEVAPKKLEGYAAITAQSKPSVAEVINPGVGLGSGFVISKDGLLLTNAHVAEGAKDGIVMIKFENGMEGAAKVVAINRDKDIALIQLPKLKSGEWPALTIASGDSLSEGDEVLAMGHPLGLPFTVTRGIISGIGGQRGNMYVSHLQTDAAINHGNSGGPLINAKTGEVVGMNSEIASTNDGNMGLGFAITADDLRAAVDMYRATGNINSAWLGVIINMTGEPSTDRGVELEQVRPGSPAALAGLKPGDILLGANGKMFGEPQTAVHELAAVIARTKPGQPIVVAVGREGQVGVSKVTLSDKK
jgi:S1-C subfamily serine protease